MRSGRQMWESGIGRKRVEERGLTRGVVDEDDEEVMFEVRRGEGGVRIVRVTLFREKGGCI